MSTGNKTLSRKMQNVSFSSVDEFFDFIPENELKIVSLLRQIIFDCIPGCKEKLSWNVPFYYKNSRICFLWPASVTWGNVHQKATVRLGFTKGYLMRDEINYLDKGDRKQVYYCDFNDLKDIDIDLVRSYIFEASMIEEIESKEKKGKQ